MASLTIPMLGGYAVDYYFGVSPYGVLAGVIIGMVLFFSMVMRLARNLASGDKEDS